LSVTGAVIGAAVGALSLSVLILVSGDWNQRVAVTVPLTVAAIFGAILGLVLAPIAAWTLMRRVPIWRAIVETALGTVVGVGAGYLLRPWLGGTAPWEIAFALAGFAAAAIRLRLTHRGPRQPATGG
jgi:hypothetical protein